MKVQHIAPKQISIENEGIISFVSYDTIVCTIKNGHIAITEGQPQSRTTAKHFNTFLQMHTKYDKHQQVRAEKRMKDSISYKDDERFTDLSLMAKTYINHTLRGETNIIINTHKSDIKEGKRSPNSATRCTFISFQFDRMSSDAHRYFNITELINIDKGDVFFCELLNIDSNVIDSDKHYTPSDIRQRYKKDITYILKDKLSD